MQGAREGMEGQIVFALLWPRLTSHSILLPQFKHPNEEPVSALRQLETNQIQFVSLEESMSLSFSFSLSLSL